jgi:hypothetical protein
MCAVNEVRSQKSEVRSLLLKDLCPAPTTFPLQRGNVVDPITSITRLKLKPEAVEGLERNRRSGLLDFDAEADKTIGTSRYATVPSVGHRAHIDQDSPVGIWTRTRFRR